jgi:DNA-binding response OmpR family regulator
MAEGQPEDQAVGVLVVTDDPSVWREVRHGFSPGVKVHIVHDSRDAWTLMQSLVPDVAIVDLQTGSAGGFGLVRDMAADSRLRDVPVLMLLERDQDGWLAGQAGARTHMTKPVETSLLVADALRLAGRE